MKRIVLVAAAAGLFALASAASAQDEKMYLTTNGGTQMVMGDGSADGTELLIGTGAKPAECAVGSYYTTDASQQMVMKCDDDSQYSLATPESGVMMADGQPYPEGSMIMTPSTQ